MTDTSKRPTTSPAPVPKIEVLIEAGLGPIDEMTATCPECNAATWHFYTVGAPGTGRGYYCATCNFRREIIPARILAIGECH